MNGKTHRAIAIATVTGFALAQGIKMSLADMTIVPILGCLVADAGGKIADIDMDTTSYGKKYPWVSKFTKHRGATHTGIILLLLTALFKLCNSLHEIDGGVWVECLLIMIILTGGLNVSIKTRITGNISAIMIETFMLAFLAVYDSQWVNVILCSIIFGFLISYGSHLFSDMHNRKGIPLAFPICRRKIYVMAIATGTWEEYLFLALFIGAIIGQVICTKFSIGLL